MHLLETVGSSKDDGVKTTKINLERHYNKHSSECQAMVLVPNKNQHSQSHPQQRQNKMRTKTAIWNRLMDQSSTKNSTQKVSHLSFPLTNTPTVPVYKPRRTQRATRDLSGQTIAVIDTGGGCRPTVTEAAWSIVGRETGLTANLSPYQSTESSTHHVCSAITKKQLRI